jgi:hypothetical protein
LKRPGARKSLGLLFVLRAKKASVVVEIAALGFPAKSLDQIPVLHCRLLPAVFHEIGGEFLRVGRVLSAPAFFSAYLF